MSYTEELTEMDWFLIELRDIKEYCIKKGWTIEYEGRNYYKYYHKIYDDDMNVIISYAENGFLDLFEYFEYFEQPTQ